MGNNQSNKWQSGKVMVALWAIVLAFLWFSVFYQMEERRQTIPKNWGEIKMEITRGLKRGAISWINQSYPQEDIFILHVKNEGLVGFVALNQLVQNGRVLILYDKNFVLDDNRNLNFAQNNYQGKNTRDLYKIQKDWGSVLNKLVNGIISVPEGLKWFIWDSGSGVDDDGWNSGNLGERKWANLNTTPEKEILPFIERGVISLPEIIWAGVISLLCLFIIGMFWYISAKEKRQKSNLEIIVSERTADLIKSETRYHTLVESLAVGIMIVELGSRKIVFHNSAAHQILQTPEGVEIEYDFLEELVPDLLTDKWNGQYPPENVLEKQGGNWIVKLPDLDVWLQITCSWIDYDRLHSLMLVLKDITEERKVEAALHRRANEFAAVYAMSHKLATQNDLDAMLDDLLDYAMMLLTASCGEIFMYDSDQKMLELKKVKGVSFQLGTRQKLGTGAAGLAAQSRKPVIIADYLTWSNRLQMFDDLHVVSVAAVPMFFGGELIGVLDVFETENQDRKFSDADGHLLDLFASQAAVALHTAQLLKETRSLFTRTEKHLNRITALFDINTVINTSLDLRLILKVLLDQVINQLDVDAADILFYHEKTRSLEFAAGVRFHTSGIENLELRLEEDYTGRVIRESKVVIVSDITQSSLGYERGKLMVMEGFVSYIASPLISKGEPIGVLEIFHRKPLEPDSEWLEFLETLAGQTAIAINNARLVEGLQRSNREIALAFDATIEGWVQMLDLRDHETKGHSQKVVALSAQMARMAGIHDEGLMELRRGALLHDIGKMGIPDRILNKPGSLSSEEWQIMRTHPQLAFDMMSNVPFLKLAAEIAYCHHEKWDGSGYPRGLRGEEIPLGARIFALADVWDALTSIRPYRDAWTRERAFEYIKEQSGVHFDPRVVEIFLKAIAEK